MIEKFYISFGLFVCIACAVAVGALVYEAVTLSAQPRMSAADPVKEYAMNRLCQISYLECRRLDTVAAKVQSRAAR